MVWYDILWRGGIARYDVNRYGVRYVTGTVPTNTVLRYYVKRYNMVCCDTV